MRLARGSFRRRDSSVTLGNQQPPRATSCGGLIFSGLTLGLGQQLRQIFNAMTSSIDDNREMDDPMPAGGGSGRDGRAASKSKL
jgi:hypothetical protein